MARGSYVWFNGKFIDEKSAKISLFTHGLHYGVGVFEGIRAYRQNGGGGAVFRLTEHVDRFFDSLKIIGLEMPYDRETIYQACLDSCRKNNFEECYIRPIAYIGEVNLAIHPGDQPPIDVAILTWEWGRYLGEEGVEKGVKLKTSTFVRPHVNSVMTKGKICGQYVTSVMAKMEAKRDGYDEGLFLDPEGFLTEGTGENIFMVTDGVVKTTPLTSVLGGITRKTVIEHLRQQGHQVVETRFSRDELWCAEEIFLTGTAAEITPVREIDGRIIGQGKPGPITQRMQREYNQIVRGDVPDYGKKWLARI